LSEKQLDILNKAAEFVKPGGTICYSTCSILKEENEHVVSKFLKENCDFTESRRKLTLPCPERGFDYDGGFVSLLKKETARISEVNR
jgi:16S rRNA (cytosine967-C5)-methyltransferase